MAGKSFSPLRYPGGKNCLADFLADLATRNGLTGGSYVEMYAGGSGAALSLLFRGVFSDIYINDFDYHIYSLWYSILNHSTTFINKILQTDISVKEWKRQQNVYEHGRDADIVDVGFATFFLNRTNRSGIIHKAGPIGGMDQSGNYKIDVRFNKRELIRRIESIAERRNDIFLTNLDAISVLKNLPRYIPDLENVLIYLDPPYYNKGGQLYLNNYKHCDHLALAETISRYLGDLHWLVSYDNVKEIKEMYHQYRMSSFDLNYTLQSKRFGSELLIFSNVSNIGQEITVNRRTSLLTII